MAYPWSSRGRSTSTSRRSLTGILTFLSLCTALEFKTIDHESPAGQAIQDWSLGHLIGPDQFTMSVIVRDVIRLVEAQLIQATQQHDT